MFFELESPLEKVLIEAAQDVKFLRSCGIIWPEAEHQLLEAYRLRQLEKAQLEMLKFRMHAPMLYRNDPLKQFSSF